MPAVVHAVPRRRRLALGRAGRPDGGSLSPGSRGAAGGADGSRRGGAAAGTIRIRPAGNSARRSPPGTSTSGRTAPVSRKARARPRAALRSTPHSAPSATGRPARAASRTGWSATTRRARRPSARATRRGAGDGADVPFSVGNYWPYATTLYDYILRAMPSDSPGTLAPDEVYGLVAWIPGRERHHRPRRRDERRHAAGGRDAGPRHLRSPAALTAPAPPRIGPQLTAASPGVRGSSTPGRARPRIGAQGANPCGVGSYRRFSTGF